ncbi:MAG: hypothetical protein IPL33_10385 [Sphingobacteriales bacterium]|nr:hypothetical protein [Sphingobacteriales bacterium]
MTVVYNYTDPATDCDYQYQTSTNVSTPLATPVVSCGIATSSSVTFMDRFGCGAIRGYI